MKVCKDCRRHLSHRQQTGQFSRLLSLGLAKQEARSLMPRCEECLSRYFNSGKRMLPQVAISRLAAPPCIFQIPCSAWDQVLRAVLSSSGLYVAVRVTEPPDHLIVVTTIPVDDMPTQPAPQVAAALERLIVARPPGSYPRFVASPEWGG